MKKTFLILSLSLLVKFIYAQTVNLCEGDSLQKFSVLADNISNSMHWEFTSGSGAQFLSPQNSDEITINFPSSGFYILKFSEINQYGCLGSVNLDIVVHSKPTSLFSYVSACINQVTNFENNSFSSGNISSVTWEVGGKIDTSYNFNHTFTSLGNHLVTLSIIDEWGCTNTYSEFVNVLPSPIADFYYIPNEVSISNPEVQFINNSSTQNLSFTWDFGENQLSNMIDPFHIYNDAGWKNISLLIEDINGCKDSIEKKLLVESELLFYFPDAFTPNNDGINDLFGPLGFMLDRLKLYDFKIYTQWGDNIFKTNDINEYWDGKLPSGINAKIDTYIWSLRIKDELGKETHHNGVFSLTR